MQYFSRKRGNKGGDAAGAGFGCLIIHKDEGKGNHRRTNAGYCEKDKLWN